MPPEVWTILDLLNWATAHLKTHSIDQPRPDAEILLSHTLGMARVDLYVQYDRPMELGELKAFKGLIQRRLKREPVAYIVGEKGFWSLDLQVSRDVLIPRPETEILVEAALSIIPPHVLGKPLRILDLGTGSGAIALALARERPGHRFYGVDRSQRALHVTLNNARKYGMEGSIALFQGSWFDAVRDGGSCFDVIVSNPPYIPTDDLETLPPEISQYEPRQALDGGPEGLDAIRLIIDKAATYTSPGGWLFLEIGCEQGTAVESLMSATKQYVDVAVVKDYRGLDRVVRARVTKEQIL